MTNNPSIEIKVKKQLGDVLFDYNLTIEGYGVTVLYGVSGAGKTSLVNLISGLLKPDSGRIAFGNDVFFDSQRKINKKIHKRDIGYVFQEARLFPHLSVEKNLYYSQKSLLHPNASEIIKVLELTDLMTRKPHTLSGGERQRVAIARALLSSPKLLLLDEPFSSLDQKKKRELINYFCRLISLIDIPIIMVSHSKEEIFRLANNLVVIDKANIIAQGKLETTWNSIQHIDTIPVSSPDVVYSAIIVEHHTNYPMTKVELLTPNENQLTGCCLWVDKIKNEVESIGILRTQLYAQDISISLDGNTKSSIRNSIVCVIKESNRLIDSQGVIVTLAYDSHIFFFAKISLWAWDDMQLETGMEVFAQIKSASVTLLKNN